MKFETFQNTNEKKPLENQATAKLEKMYGENWEEVLKEKEQQARRVSQIIGLDFSMNVTLNEPNKGSFYNFEKNSIKIDPLDGDIEFIAAHEGSHRAISKSLKNIKTRKKEENLKKQMLENQRKNGWHFNLNAVEDVAVNDWVSGIFPKIEQLTKKNYSDLGKKIEELRLKNGSIPESTMYGFEAINERYNGELSKNISKELETALKNTKSLRGYLYSSIPFSRSEKEVLAKSWERYKTYNLIWDKEIEKLAKEDQKKEEIKEYIKHDLSGNQQGSHGAQGSQESPLSQDEKNKIKEHIEKNKEKLKEYLEEKLENGEMSEEELQEALDRSMPIDIDELDLDEKTKQKISELVKENQEIKEQAEKNLEALEEALNEKLESKLMSQKETIEEKEKKRQEKEKQTKTEEELDKKVSNLLEGEWEKQRVMVLKEINEMYGLIEKLFQKNKLEWKDGYNAGQRINLKRAMQSEAYPKLNIWEQKRAPLKENYRFTILNDQSGSMYGENIENDFLAKIIFSETLSKLKIPFEILGFSGVFNNTIKEYKTFQDKKLSTKRKELSNILEDVDGSTPTFEATEIATERLLKQRKKGSHNAHFLFVVTDGDPNGDIEKVRELNKRIKKENQQIVIGMGIGKGINEENLRIMYGDQYIYCDNPKDFPKAMSKILKKIFYETQNNKKH